jgi:hypothetical protein
LTLAVSETRPLKPPLGVIVTVNVVVPPCATDRLDGDAMTVKFGARGVALSSFDWGPVPATLTAATL